jgi:hypothetical protein
LDKRHFDDGVNVPCSKRSSGVVVVIVVVIVVDVDTIMLLLYRVYPLQ